MAGWRGSIFPRGEGGFATDPRWYDLHVASEPRYQEALRQVVLAAPPLPLGASVADLGAGTGALAAYYRAAYPDARLHLIDPNGPKLALASARLGRNVLTHEQALDPDQPTRLGPGGFDLVISGLTLHVIADWAKHPDSTVYAHRNRALMQQVQQSLTPGGVFIYADFTRHGLGVREHLALMEEAGFIEVDCAWRNGDLVVIGGERSNE